MHNGIQEYDNNEVSSVAVKPYQKVIGKHHIDMVDEMQRCYLFITLA